jgi:hypothetical protein
VLSDLASKQGLSDISDDHIVQWANEKVKESGKATKMRNFKDSGLKNSIFLLELVSAIEPRAVDWEVVRRCFAFLFCFFDDVWCVSLWCSLNKFLCEAHVEYFFIVLLYLILSDEYTNTCYI